MPERQILRALVPALLAAAIAAQRPVVTVGGSNPNFTDLPQAVAAAAPGSIVEVRAGSYTGFVTSKPLRIALHGATVVPPPGASYAIVVQNLTGADEFVLHGSFATVLPGVLGAMRIANTSAPVVVESVTFGGTFESGLEIFNAGAVFVTRSILLGNPGLSAQFCDLVSSENVVGNAVGAGAIVADSLFDSARAIYIGTNQPGLRVFSSDARLSSDGTGAMLVVGQIPVPISPIEAIDSTVYWQPGRFVLAPINGAPALGMQNSTEVQREVPMLNAGPAPLGGPATARMTNGVPVVGMIAMGFVATTPIVTGPLGIYLEPGTFVLSTAGVVDQAGLTVGITVPTDPALRGNLYCFQGVTFPPGAPMATSSPALWYVE